MSTIRHAAIRLGATRVRLGRRRVRSRLHNGVDLLSGLERRVLEMTVARKLKWGRCRSSVALATLVLCVSGCHRPLARTGADSVSAERGRILMLPGISNTSAELAGLSSLLNDAYPDQVVDVRPWGPVMFLFSNLSDYEQNLRKAKALAEELAAYRLAHPGRSLDVLGYSGGGAMACFVVASLPEGVQVDRLVLVAPAISRQYPLETSVLPKVKDFAVVFTSAYDPLVGAGTRVFGTMDRRNSASAGSSGFPIEDEKLVQVHWDPKMLVDGHFGGHLDYLSPAWQRKYLLPAFDHRSSLERLSGVDVPDVPSRGSTGSDASSRALPKSGAASTNGSTNDPTRDQAILATPPR